VNRVVLSFVFFAFIYVEASAQTYGLDNTDPSVFSKFRIPKTELSALWFNTNLSYVADKTSYYSSNDDNFYSNFNYSLAPQYYLLKESDDNYLSLNATANGSYLRYRNTQVTSFSPTDYFIHTTDNIYVYATGEYRSYRANKDMFFSIGSTDLFNTYADYYDRRNPDSTRSTSYNGSKTQHYAISFGVGWGKMRNVTSVVSALRFQERLKQLNLLNNNLSEKSIEDLAEQFYRQGYYSKVHVRPDKFFWDDVEKTLSNDGVSLSGLNQYADSYIREVPGELRFNRNEGIVGGVNLQLSYNNTYNSGLFSPISEQLFTLATAYFDYSHQLDLNSQLRFDASLSAGPNLVKDSPVKQEYVFNADAGYDYELTDRIVVSLSDIFGLTFQNMGVQGKDLSNDLNFNLNYFVEDNMSLTATYSWTYNDDKYINYYAHEARNDHSINIGFTYYLQRGFLYK
jgi:hypothetical protein